MLVHCKISREGSRRFGGNCRFYAALTPICQHIIYSGLEGLYLFETESSNEFKDWAVDLPPSYADSVLEQWYTKEMEPMAIELQSFIETNLPRWRKNLKNTLASKN